MRALFAFFALTAACTSTDVELRPITRLPHYAVGYVDSYLDDQIRLSEGVAFAFDCETSAGGVCYGLEASVDDPSVALVEQIHLDSDVIREIEVDADRLPTGDSRVFLLVGLAAGSTTLVLTHDEGATEITVDVVPR